MTTPILNYRSADEFNLHDDEPLIYVSDEFLGWHTLNVCIGLVCLFLPRMLGTLGLLLVFAMPGVAIVQTLALGLPLAIKGFDKSSGPLALRIVVALLGLVGPALTAYAWFFGWGYADWCC